MSTYRLVWYVTVLINVDPVQVDEVKNGDIADKTAYICVVGRLQVVSLTTVDY